MNADAPHLKEPVRPMAPFVAEVFYKNSAKPPTDDATINSTSSSSSSSRKKSAKRPLSKSVNLALSKHKKKSNNNNQTLSSPISPTSPTSPTSVNNALSSFSCSSSSRSNSIVTVNSSEPNNFLPSPRNEDIRLTYARIFMEAFNNFERVSQQEQLFDFCTKDCMLTVKWTGEQG